jgi:Na+-driven multidrug efflux pump
VSNLIGEGKTELVWQLLRRILYSALWAVTPMLLLFALFPHQCLRIYTNNIPLINSSIDVIYVMCIASFFQIPAFIMFNSVSGTGAVKMTVLIETVNLFLYSIFVWLVIIKMRPTPAVAWMGEILYQVTMMIFCLIYLMSGKWKNNKL